MKKQIITIITVGAMTSSLVIPMAFAQTVTPVTTGTRTERLQERQDARVTDLKTRADNEITRRINSLSTLTTKLGNMKHLTSTQITSFTTEVNTEISNLTALKAKIDADTDITTLRADVKSIVTEYRVYYIFIPQITILAAADRALNVVDMFNALYTKLQQRIQEAQTAGNNVTTLTTTLSDMQTNITNAQTTANQIITMVLPLNPSGYPGNKTTLQSARTMFKTIYQDFVSARKDAKTIIQTLRSLKTSGTPTPSETPEPTK